MAIASCSGIVCVSEYQDKKYGRRKRVVNKCNNGFRCTVCLSIIDEGKIDKSFNVEES